MEELLFSLFYDKIKGINNSTPKKDIRLSELFSYYQSDVTKLATQQLQSTLDEAERKRLKLLLPSFTPSGTFAPTRAKENNVHHNNKLIAFDVDGVDKKEAVKLRNHLSFQQGCIMCVISPRQEGVKALFLMNQSIAYEEREKTLETNKIKLCETLGIEAYTNRVDKLQWNRSQTFFIAYDEGGFFNEKAKPLKYTWITEEVKKPKPKEFTCSFFDHKDYTKRNIKIYLLEATQRIIKTISEAPNGLRHSTIWEVQKIKSDLHYLPEMEEQIFGMFENLIEEMFIDEGTKEVEKEIKTLNYYWEKAVNLQNKYIEEIISAEQKIEKEKKDLELKKSLPSTASETNFLSNVFCPNWNNQPEPIPPILTLNDEPILNFQNITSIIASPGYGKSSVFESILSNMLNPSSDCLGFKVDSNVVKKAIYIDFERRTNDVWNSFNRMCQRSEISKGTPIENVFLYGFHAVVNYEERMKKLEAIIQEIKPQLVLLDGAGDLVKITNSEDEAVVLRGWFRQIANTYKCSILTTLHPNPGTEKPRGHLGSELLRESDCVLIIKQDENSQIRTITTNFSNGKNRNGGKAEGRFKFDIDKNMFVSCDEKDGYKERNMSVLDRSLIETILIDCGLVNGKRLNSGDLKSTLKLSLKKHAPSVRTSTDSMRENLNFLVKEEYLKIKEERSSTFYFRLLEEKAKSEELFKFSPY